MKLSRDGFTTYGDADGGKYLMSLLQTRQGELYASIRSPNHFQLAGSMAGVRACSVAWPPN